MEKIIYDLKKIFAGEIETDEITRKKYSHDASIYELIPEIVAHPKNPHDISQLVRFVSAQKTLHPSLSITPRSAGTDMSGGPLGNSIVIDMTTHFNAIHEVTHEFAHAQPGVFYRDLDPLLVRNNALFGSVPASRAICTIGGIVANNSGGEQSLHHGNAERNVAKMSVIFADGNEYIVEPLTKNQLMKKMAQNDFEGTLYKSVYNLIENYYDQIHNARPKVNKNSMGYNLWSVWDRETGIFDMTRLISGSQGTLGIITDLTLKLAPLPKHSGLLLLYLPNDAQLGEIIKEVMSHNPSTFEGFDDITFELGIKHFSTFKKMLGLKEWAKQQASLLASVAKFKAHLPNMVLMIEFADDDETVVAKKLVALEKIMKKFKCKTEIAGDEESSKKFWSIRRASLGLLRQRVKHKYASPWIDDLTVQPQFLPEFLPQLRKIIRKYKLPATIAGHFGDGNFHVIPLLDIERAEDQRKLEPVMREVVPLVLKYKGTLAGEHNDGMVRGPWLPAVFGEEMYEIFKLTKHIFDPTFIFNPHKKTDASWDFSMQNIRKSNDDGLIK